MVGYRHGHVRDTRKLKDYNWRRFNRACRKVKQGSETTNQDEKVCVKESVITKWSLGFSNEPVFVSLGDGLAYEWYTN